MEVEAEGDVDPLRVGRRQRADRAVADLDLAAADVDPVELGPLDDDVVQLDAVGAVDLDPVLAAAHGHVADGDVVGRDQMPPRTIAPGSPITSARGRERAAPGGSPAARWTVGGSTAQAVPTTASSSDRRRGGEDHAGAPQLAAVLGPAEPQQRQTRVRQHLEHEPGAGEEARPPARAARSARAAGLRPSSPRARAGRAAARASPAGRGAAGGRAGRRARARSPSISADQLERPPVVQDRGRARPRRGTGSERGGEPRLDSASQRVGHRLDPAPEPARRDLHPDERVGRRERPLRGTPASASVRVASVSAGTVESSASTIQRSSVSSPCSATSRGEQQVVLEAALEARRADHLLGAVRAPARPGSVPHAPRARAARPSSRPGG